MDAVYGNGYYPIAFNQPYSIVCTCWSGGDIVTAQCFPTYFDYWIGERVPSTTIQNYFYYICIGI